MACASPRLSVVVPVYHDVETLPACLGSLAASDLDRSSWELIVVSHTSAGDASVASAQFADTIIRLPDRNWGAGYARNRGAEVARGEYILFVSSDVLVERQALRRVVEIFDRDQDVSALCGVYIDHSVDSGLISHYRNLLRVFEFERGLGSSDSFTPGLAAIRRATFVDSGMFDEWRVGVRRIESAEFGRRILAVGGRIVVHADVKGVHVRDWSFVEAVVESVRDHGIPWQSDVRATDDVVSPALRFARRLDRTNTVLVWAAVAASIIAYYHVVSRGWWIVLGLLFVVGSLSLPLCIFLVRHRSFVFALLALPLHLLDLVVGGLGVAYSWIVRHTVGEPKPSPTIEAFVEVGLKTWPPVPSRRAPRTQRASSP